MKQFFILSTTSAPPVAVLAALLTGFFLFALQAHGSEGSAAREGADLFRAGRLEEAAGKFREALEEDPSSREIRRSLAHTLASLGQRSIQAGDLQSASDYLEEAVEAWPDEAAFHFLLAVASFRRGDLYDARRSVEEALDLDGDHRPSRELLGDIYYQEGYLTRAIPEWEQAMEGGGPEAHRLQAKIERAGKESDAESGFGRDVSVHFTLQYDGPVSRETVRAVLDILEEAYSEIGGELGSYPSGDIPVILYSKILFTEITRSPMWVAGTFDGKIRIPVGGVSGAGQAPHLRPILTHELAHAFIRAMATTGLPLWFEEGLAKHFEGIPTERAEEILGGHGDVPSSFSGLNSGLRGRGQAVKSSYLASLLAVRTLIDSEGFWTVRRILEGVGEGLPFDEAFREETGMEVGEFEERWRSNLP